MILESAGNPGVGGEPEVNQICLSPYGPPGSGWITDMYLCS